MRFKKFPMGDSGIAISEIWYWQDPLGEERKACNRPEHSPNARHRVLAMRSGDARRRLPKGRVLLLHPDMPRRKAKHCIDTWVYMQPGIAKGRSPHFFSAASDPINRSQTTSNACISFKLWLALTPLS